MHFLFFFYLQNKEKARSLAEQFCARNGGYRMPFAWTAIHLVDVITGASAAEPQSQGEKEQPSPKDQAPGRRVKNLLYMTTINI